jgi:tetratricopeptide (TPR) repeat protein
LRTDPADRWSSMDALLDALQKDPSVVRRRWAIVVAATAGIAGIGVAAGRHGARENRPTCHVPGDRFTHVWEADAVPGSRRAAITNAFHDSGHPYAADVLAGTSRLLDGYVNAWSSMYTDSCEATNVRGEQSAEVLDLRMSCLRDRWNEMRALSDVLVDPKDEVVANAVKAAAALTPVDRCADLKGLRAAVPPPTDPAMRKKVESLRMNLATAKALLDTGRFAKAASAAMPLVSEARTLGHAPTLSEALYRLAEVQLSLGRPTEAGSNFDEAIWTAVAARDDEIAATAAIDQIFVAGYLKRDTSSARRWFREAEALLARMGGHEILNAWMQHNFGAALETEGDLEGAADRYERAMAIKEKLLGGDHPDVALSLTNLASVLLVLGRPEDALVHSNRGVRIMEKVLGMEHPETATQWGNRAEILNQLGRYVEARRDAERGLAVWRRELGSENADQLFFLAPLGEARMGLGESREAAALLERALGIAERHDVRSETRRLRFALARALWQEGHDRVRAIEVGRLAASSMPVDDKTISGGAWATRDHGIQREAAEWVAARQSETKRGSRVAGRFRSGLF